MVMIVKNNYFLTAENEEGPGFIANGDIAEIRRIRKYEEIYGSRFAEMTLFFPDYNFEVDTKVIMDVLSLDSRLFRQTKPICFFITYLQIISTSGHAESNMRRSEAIPISMRFRLNLHIQLPATRHREGSGRECLLIREYSTGTTSLSTI